MPKSNVIYLLQNLVHTLDRLRPRRKHNLVPHNLDGLQFVSLPVFCTITLSHLFLPLSVLLPPSHYCQRPSQLPHLPRQSLVMSNIQVHVLHPILIVLVFASISISVGVGISRCTIEGKLKTANWNFAVDTGAGGGFEAYVFIVISTTEVVDPVGVVGVKGGDVDGSL